MKFCDKGPSFETSKFFSHFQVVASLYQQSFLSYNYRNYSSFPKLVDDETDYYQQYHASKQITALLSFSFFWGGGLQLKGRVN